METVEVMKEAESRAWPLWNIAAVMAEAGDVNGALTLAWKEKVAHPKAYALLGTAQGVLDRLDFEARARSKDGAP
jgi:hypothetical protein